MTDLSSKSVLVYDSGLFVHVAQCLAEKFGKVFYYSPHEGVMPVISQSIVGDGFENIERVDQPLDLIGNADCWCFTDVGNGALQNHLSSMGESVWGHHGGDELEVYKGTFLTTLKHLGMETPSYILLDGLSDLRNYIWDKNDLYIKISRWRGSWETAHWRNRELDAGMLDCAAYRLGPAAEAIRFYVFDAIDADIEDGIDTWCIDGQWPKHVLHAMERKDKSLIGAIQPMADISEEVRGVNDRFGPVLAKYGYRGAFSTEVRIGEQAYFIDPTCRFGSPPSQLQTALIKNLPEVIWAGAHGELVEPEAPEPFGAQVLITADREKEEWLSFAMPEELRPFIKSSFACEIDGILTIAPNPLENWAGWLVATGDSISAVVDTLRERKELLPDGFDCDLSSLVDLLRELDSAKEEGVEITKQEIPPPESVLSD